MITITARDIVTIMRLIAFAIGCYLIAMGAGA